MLGLEQPLVTLMAVYEVLGQYGGPTYVLYQLPGFETIIREGTQEQIDAVMAYLGTGEQIWNSACTEPGAGSDVSSSDHQLQASRRQDLPERHQDLHHLFQGR